MMNSINTHAITTTRSTTANATCATRTKRRDGRSLKVTPLDVSKALLVELGYAPEEAALVVNTRRYLPCLPDPKEPKIDAEALWVRIGKPHKRFRAWATHYIEPMVGNDNELAEISAFLKSTKTKPRKGYLLSRNVAAHLAMQANTPEGRAIRDYFLLMERVAIDMTRYAHSRAAQLIQQDQVLCMTIHQNAPRGLSQRQHADYCKATEKEFKSRFAEALTGFRAGHWRQASGEGNRQGIRDRLGLDDLDTYGTAYLVAVSVYRATGGSIDAAMETVRAIHEIDPCRYFHPEMIDSMVVWELGREDDYTGPVADTHVTAWDEITVTTTDEAAQCCHP
ncbi:hypothetical protein LH425_14225 [Laribacter hongkongensis]|uniref:hypothetical protein n=1 Tax=Laribacter hongkongensis TaxID=168471 RepID=UPI001EFCB6A6|nr:hypothetical protein [Laribacter hongkongensis]MCG9066157.1 hypothetical protein [Laribacter hongkongensis]